MKKILTVIFAILIILICMGIASNSFRPRAPLNGGYGGRPDLAGNALPQVTSSTLLIVGGLDYPVIEMNEEALAQMRCEKELKIVPGATHLFEEPGTWNKLPS
jgi:putative phosphoribosyl transferase